MIKKKKKKKRNKKQREGRKYRQLLVVAGLPLQHLHQRSSKLKASLQGLALLALGRGIVTASQNSLDDRFQEIGVDGVGGGLHLGGELGLGLGEGEVREEGLEGHFGGIYLSSG